ncbi:MAG: hypothetical protein J4F40_08880 [Alphaproteobacteria bacterium]|nr:hypothetical protein [Alphaproteobacteria bacterium]MCY4499342.1 hypothetical protein [Rhodospirillaceae bacterium]
MSKTNHPDSALSAKQRVEKGLQALRTGLGAYVGKHVRDRHRRNGRHCASRDGPRRRM